MLGNFGMTEILIITVIVLLLFGAKRLPEIGASMGKGIREFKKSINDVNRSVSEIERDERAELGRGEPPAPARRDDENQPEPKRLLS
jgi:sec-independent protein translocase protein TatA